jgi:hypothetical protein
MDVTLAQIINELVRDTHIINAQKEQIAALEAQIQELRAESKEAA